jgi:hypothetical protein
MDYIEILSSWMKLEEEISKKIRSEIQPLLEQRKKLEEEHSFLQHMPGIQVIYPDSPRPEKKRQPPETRPKKPVEEKKAPSRSEKNRKKLKRKAENSLIGTLEGELEEDFQSSDTGKKIRAKIQKLKETEPTSGAPDLNQDPNLFTSNPKT